MLTSDIFEWLPTLVITAAVVISYLGYRLASRYRLKHWIRVDAEITSCDKTGTLYEGSQEYGCTYVFIVDGVRQAGSFSFTDAPEKLRELRAALTGKIVPVVYNPEDCTTSALIESEVTDSLNITAVRDS